MIPVDEEFRSLYFAYGLAFVILVGGVLLSEKKKLFISNLTVYSIYTALLTFFFVDEDNFKYGSSLVVLFYGAAFLIIHLVGFSVWKIYQSVSKRVLPVISRDEYWDKFDHLILALQKDERYDIVLELKEAQKYVNGMTDGWFKFLDRFSRTISVNKHTLSREQIHLANKLIDSLQAGIMK